jgi:hypothetical protein
MLGEKLATKEEMNFTEILPSNDMRDTHRHKDW